MFAELLAAVIGGNAGDDELARRIARGDARALRAVYDRCGGLALAVALRVLRQRAESEEVVQEAFVEVWRRAAGFDGRRGSLEAWIATIAHSRAIGRLRSRSSAERTALAAGREQQVPRPQPLEAVEARQERERVLGALQALPAEQRQVLELAYYAGLTQREIAEKLGDPLGTVKTRMRLGLARLGELLAVGA